MTHDPDALWKQGADAMGVDEASKPVLDEPADLVAESGPSPWSSGSRVHFEHQPIVVPADPDVVEPDEPSTASSRRGLLIIAGVAAAFALAAIAGFVTTRPSAPTATPITAPVAAEPVVTTASSDPLVDEPFAGADRRRLPASLTQQWATVVEGASATSASSVVVGSDAVFAVFEESVPVTVSRAPGSIIVALDPATGDERWRVESTAEVDAFGVLGVLGDVLVLEQLDLENRSVIGFDTTDGSQLWERRTNDPGVHVVLEGSSLITRVSFTVNARLTFIDPTSGDEVGRVPGRLFATDFLGIWYVRNGNSATRLDLSNGWVPPTEFSDLEIRDGDPASVVDDRLVAIADGFVELGTDDGVSRAEITGDFVGDVDDLESRSTFTRLSPMADDALVLSGPGAVFGASLDGDTLDIVWRAEGLPIDTQPTDRGLSLLMATDGGATNRVIDGSTGREITQIPMVPGALDTLELVGNGVVVKEPAAIGFERVALDLDGNRLWSLVGEGPIAIGDGVVLAYGAGDDGVSMTAYGDA